MRTLRRVGIAALVVLLLVLLGSISGNQPQRDAVVAAERELGIDLESRRIDLGTVRLHVVLAGPKDGPPVVLLHGYPEFWFAWYRQMGRLAQAGFRVIVPDQRGYNLSDKPQRVEDYRVDVLASDIARLDRDARLRQRLRRRARLGRRRRLAAGDPPSRIACANW